MSFDETLVQNWYLGFKKILVIEPNQADEGKFFPKDWNGREMSI